MSCPTTWLRHGIEVVFDTHYLKKPVCRITHTNTVCAVYDRGESTKTFLYGSPEAGVFRFTRMETIARSEDGKSFAVRMVERRASSRQAYIVWVMR